MWDEYTNYTSVKSVKDIEDETGACMWFEGETYKVIEILKNDRLAEVECEFLETQLIGLEDEDFEFIEGTDDANR